MFAMHNPIRFIDPSGLFVREAMRTATNAIDSFTIGIVVGIAEPLAVGVPAPSAPPGGNAVAYYAGRIAGNAATAVGGGKAAIGGAGATVAVSATGVGVVAAPATAAVAVGGAAVAGSAAWSMGGNINNLVMSVGNQGGGNQPPAKGGRGSNNLRPDPNATGDHTTFRRDASGNITHHETWRTNPQNPSGFDSGSSFHGTGKGHFNKVTEQRVGTPHVHDSSTPGGIRPATPDEIPR